MSSTPLHVVVFGLSVTSSWGNGHATTFRGLLRELAARGHRVTFMERDVPWYASNRDMPDPPFCDLHLYTGLEELKDRYAELLDSADFIIVGSYVPQGIELARQLFETVSCPVGFYDIDTPVTLSRLKQGDCFYLKAGAIQRYDVYLSFTGGPTLEMLEKKYGSPMARPLYCSVDPQIYYPVPTTLQYDLGYLGTYSDDRQEALETLMLEPARRQPHKQFVVAGPQYPESIDWPANVGRIDHLSPDGHCVFYNAQRFTLNITRRAMIEAGWSPSVRLFEAAACGTPIIGDWWEGLNEFFRPGEEILVSRRPEDTVEYLNDLSDRERKQIGQRARTRIAKEHTAAIRAGELERTMLEVLGSGHPKPDAVTNESVRS